jgi:dUTP pyrophosphatase
MALEVNIKRVDKTLPLPQYETRGAVAFDFVVRVDTIIPAKGMGRAPGNVIIEIPEGHMLWVSDRSSTLKKTGLIKTEGIIDQDFCGDEDEILLQFYNPTHEHITLKRGDRVSQGVFLQIGKAEWNEVLHMGNRDRGGFGTTDAESSEKIHISLESREPIIAAVANKSRSIHGKLIVLYGVNNLGKSTQAKLLAERMQQEGMSAEYMKYHVYDLEPTGGMLNEYLRSENPYRLNEREFQILAAVNKYHNQSAIAAKLEQGVTVVLEDYWATSIAWGVGNGVDKDFLTRLQEGLIREDLAFLFDGERFLESREHAHHFESHDELTERVRGIHKELSQEYGWTILNANQPIELIAELIWKKVKKVLS